MPNNLWQTLIPNVMTLEEAFDSVRCDHNTLSSGPERLYMAAEGGLLELAIEVAKDYEDAADWKDARPRLAALARGALEKLK